MPYYVIDAAGNPYGPAELGLLQQWVQEGRITASTTIRDGNSGQQMVASAIPGLFPFGSSYSAPSQPGQASPYGPSPYQQQIGPGPAYYPRPFGADSGAKDGTAALVLGILSIMFGLPICCPLLGIPLGIVGIVFARRAQASGYNALAALIMSWVGIALGCIFMGLAIIGVLMSNTTM
jgi:hypothetical protein